MAYALISPNEPVYNYDTPPTQIGERVAEVAANSFDIAPPLFWVTCADTVTADVYYYDPTTQQILLKPTPPAPPTPPPAKKSTGTSPSSPATVS